MGPGAEGQDELRLVCRWWVCLTRAPRGAAVDPGCQAGRELVVANWGGVQNTAPWMEDPGLPQGEDQGLQPSHGMGNHPLPGLRAAVEEVAM